MASSKHTGKVQKIIGILSHWFFPLLMELFQKIPAIYWLISDQKVINTKVASDNK